MHVSVIVPSNNIKRINEFINSYDNLVNFSDFAELIIIGNGELKEEHIPILPNVSFIRYDKEFDIVPFTELRGIGMKESKSDFFLFLDDDHRFKPSSDIFLIECLNFLINHNECGVLQLEKDHPTRSGFYIKRNAHIWTSRGLFIKNIGFNYNELFKLKGACEDLLYGFEVLNQMFLPYCIWNSGIRRNSKVPNNHKELHDKSYNESLLNKNIIGYIRKKYNDFNWKFYGNLRQLKYPNSLKTSIKSRLTNLI